MDDANVLVDDQTITSHNQKLLRAVADYSQYLQTLAVSNSGTRLPAEFQERIFDSLVSLREKRGATPHLGLGLYIVRLVAMAHGGSVKARNLPRDQGVEFVIHLPVSH